MPSGAKKRKAAKRKHHKMGGGDHHKQQDSPTSPDPSSSPPLIQPQGNGREERPVVIEDEYEEMFETPRLQPETPYYSMENMKMDRIDEMEIPGGVNADPVCENSRVLDLEITLNDEESLKEMKSEESENSSDSEEGGGLKLTKLGGCENSNASEDGDGTKDMTLDESVGATEEKPSTEKELAVEKSDIENHCVAVVDEGRTPGASISSADASSFNVKEVKVLLRLDKEISAVNGTAISDVEVPSEMGGDGNIIVESKLQKDEGLEEATLINLDAEKEQPVPAMENSKDVTESICETPPQIDVDLISNKLEKSVEKSSSIIDSSDLITEEANQATKAPAAPHVNLERVVSVARGLPPIRVKEAKNCSLNAGEVEIAQRKVVARGPAEVRRATIWNCCGLLEVLTSSDR